MNYIINGQVYKVEIIRKNNKNTYIRVKPDLTIYVTTNYFVTKKQIEYLLNQNIDYLKKMIDKSVINQEKQNKFYYLGNEYQVIYMDTNTEIYQDKIFTKNEETLNKWLKKEITNLYKERVDYLYDVFQENIPYPKIKFRKMKTRWGVCNKRDLSITLNTELIKYDIECLDYVIIHELTHFIHFNHSQSFWNVVEKYYPNYKKIRKKLKE